MEPTGSWRGRRYRSTSNRWAASSFRAWLGRRSARFLAPYFCGAYSCGRCSAESSWRDKTSGTPISPPYYASCHALFPHHPMESAPLPTRETPLIPWRAARDRLAACCSWFVSECIQVPTHGLTTKPKGRQSDFSEVPDFERRVRVRLSIRTASWPPARHKGGPGPPGICFRPSQCRQRPLNKTCATPPAAPRRVINGVDASHSRLSRGLVASRAKLGTMCQNSAQTRPDAEGHQGVEIWRQKVLVKAAFFGE